MADTKHAYALERILAAAQLPAMPTSAIRVLELSRDANNGPAEFARPIEADPGLAMQVLRFVNSSYFGFSREISSVKQGIALVGIRTIKNFVMWNAVFSLMPNPKCGPFDLKLLWQDSLRRAVFARVLGKQWRLKESDDMFAAALLQDMAVPLLAKSLPKEYAEFLAQRAAGQVRLSDLEQARFGWTHAEAAAHLAETWHLPGEFVTWMRHHTRWEDHKINEPCAPAQMAVALSALLPPEVDDGWAERESLTVAYHQVRPEGAADLVAVLDLVDREYAEFAPLLQIGASGTTLVDRYQATLAVGA